MSPTDGADGQRPARTPVSRRRFLLATGGAASVGLGALASGRGAGEVGAVSVDGTRSHLRLTGSLAAAFRRRRPDVPVSVDASGTADAARRFVDGDVDVYLGGRPLTADRRTRAAATDDRVASSVVVLGRHALVASPTWRRRLGSGRLGRLWREGDEWRTFVESHRLRRPHRRSRVGGDGRAGPSQVTARGAGASEATVLVYGDRAHQYADGSGGTGYYEVAPDELVVDGATNRSATDGDVPLLELGFLYSRGGAAGAEEVRALTRLYERAAVDGGPDP